MAHGGSFDGDNGDSSLEPTNQSSSLIKTDTGSFDSPKSHMRHGRWSPRLLTPTDSCGIAKIDSPYGGLWGFMGISSFYVGEAGIGNHERTPRVYLRLLAFAIDR